MIEILNKRKVIREFLKGYSEELWKEVIPDVLEIGVLILQTSYKKLMFEKQELKNILSKLEYNFS